jgi:hypothetical protein
MNSPGAKEILRNSGLEPEPWEGGGVSGDLDTSIGTPLIISDSDISISVVSWTSLKSWYTSGIGFSWYEIGDLLEQRLSGGF